MITKSHTPRLLARSATVFGAVLSVSLWISPTHALEAAGSGIQGAWVEQSHNCDDIFTSKGGRPVFKKPVNLFAPALIITGKRLVTPQASCRLRSAKPEGNRTSVSLQCANSISDAQVQVYLGKTLDGMLIRYYDANDASGSRYVACPVK